MSHDEESGNSIPYIDDTNTEDEINLDKCHHHRHSLSITEKYFNKNRRVDIQNHSLADGFILDSSCSVAPLAEIDVTDSGLSNYREENAIHRMKCDATRESAMKLVIRGWNSTISIQGLDNHSMITLKGKDERARSGKEMRVSKQDKFSKNRDSFMQSPVSRAKDKPKKKRWKMLTKSLMSKSTRCDRRGIDERYPKYVLLKNEDDEDKEIEESLLCSARPDDGYPKMIVLNDTKAIGMTKRQDEKNRKRPAERSEFKLKRSFKNKTNPMRSGEEISSQKDERTKNDELKEPGPSGNHIKRDAQINDSSKKQDATRRKTFREKRKSFQEGRPEPVTRSKSTELPLQRKSESVFDIGRKPPPQDQAFDEIEGVLNETLKLCPDVGDDNDNSNSCCRRRRTGNQNHDKYDTSQLKRVQQEFHSGMLNDFCNVADAGFLPSLGDYVPIYDACTRCRHTGTPNLTNRMRENNLCANSEYNVIEQNQRNENGEDVNLENLQFGILSTFFPESVLVMKTYKNNYAEKKQESDDRDTQANGTAEDKPILQGLEAPVPQLPVNSVLAERADNMFEDCDLKESIAPAETPGGDCSTLNELSTSSFEEIKTKTDDTETTKYLCCQQEAETADADAESVTTACTLKTDQSEKWKHKRGDAENDEENLTLTKVGYKMYDNLTKLSLKREKEIVETEAEVEVEGRTSPESEMKSSPCNITLESNNNVIRISMPENRVNFAIVNPGGPDIKIGVANAETTVRQPEVSKLAIKNQPWQGDDGKRGLETTTARGKNPDEPHVCRKDYPTIKLAIADRKELYLSIETTKCDEKGQGEPESPTAKEAKVEAKEEVDLAGGGFNGRGAFGGNLKNLSPRKAQLLKNLKEKLESGGGDSAGDKTIEKSGNELLAGKANEFPEVFLVQKIDSRPRIARKSSEVPSTPKKSSTVLKTTGPLREYYCQECLATMRMFEDENPSVKSIVDKFETIIQLKSY